jgi:S-adenosylmethionine synthetase
MPAALMYSHKLVEKLADIRKNHLELMPYLRPDAKAQVTVAYDDAGKITGVTTIVVSTQHDPGVSQEQIAEDIKKHVIPSVIPADMLGPDTVFHINPTGKFEIGGPHGDTGLTGRKIIVDTYGGKAPHGGGAFSGKDPTKVDRSAAYAARHLAKNIVAAGLAEQCTIQVSYAIGVKEPVSLLVDMHGTGTISSDVVSSFIMKNIDLSPKGIIERLKLQRPIYRATAAYGHFGRNEFPWEQLDLVPMFSSLS